MMSPTSANQRKQMDFTKLMAAGYEVDLVDGSSTHFHVTFSGPKETIYHGAFYRIRVELPEQYPFSSPSIGFEPYTIFHPNIDERSGSVCLDVINQTWTPMYSLVNIFDVFLPQLLTYPNPADPLNTDAASLFAKDTKGYESRVKALVAETIKKWEARQAEKNGVGGKSSSGLAGGGASGSSSSGVSGHQANGNGHSAGNGHSPGIDSSASTATGTSPGAASSSSAALRSPAPNDNIGDWHASPEDSGAGNFEFQLTGDGEEDDLDAEFD